MRMKTALLGLALSVSVSTLAFAGQITINTDASDPAPKKAFEELVADFQKKHPDVTVKVNTFDHEGYKGAIRNFLTADAPDVVNWYAGNRMAPFVKAGLFEDVSDLWAKEGLNDQLKSAASSMTIPDLAVVVAASSFGNGAPSDTQRRTSAIARAGSFPFGGMFTPSGE